MQPLPADFLEAQAKRYDLSPEQTEALIKRLGDKDSEQADADALHITVNALRNRMTGVYNKFSISKGGPGKLCKLHDFLLEEYRKSASTTAEATETETDIDALVQTVRAKVYGDIQARCGTMRVLDMEQPIGLGDIYTSVNILEKLSGRRRLGLDELLQDCDPENFDRFLLGQVRHKRVPGLQAVEEQSQLMILGKPGAGKTTFMKRLAILCNQGEFQPQRVPVFVTLKDYAETEGKPKLQAYIQNQWQTCGVKAADAISTVLNSGKALVLLDGLDEVYETDHDRVLQDIKTFAHQFRTCQFVITCRIAAREYIFEQFTEVEVADFDQEQITEFATKWFTVKHDPKKAETFIQRLEVNRPIQELATNPLLLTLLCLVFGEAADFPANRAELYKEGLDVLLKKWDGKRNIERDQVYKRLSLKHKEHLLSQLAFETFEQGSYFFKQSMIEQHILQYIRNLSGASDNEESLQIDSESVLKSIEAQHGLLVERARKIYSFSHLTFHEYFAAKHITNPDKNFESKISRLAQLTTKNRWREVILMASEMINPADHLLVKMRDNVASLSQENASLLAILEWTNKKSNLSQSSLGLRNLRHFYFSCLGSSSVGYRPDHDLLDILRGMSAFEDIVYDYRILEDRTDVEESRTSVGHKYQLFNDSRLDEELIIIHALSHVARLTPAIDRFIQEEGAYILNPDMGIRQGIERACHAANVISSHIYESLNALRDLFPKMDGRNSKFKDWWKSSSSMWTGELKSVVYNCYDLDAGVEIPLFEREIKKTFDDYSRANSLIVSCLESDSYINKPVRKHIEDTLLLPLSEIEKYPVPDAIANL